MYYRYRKNYIHERKIRKPLSTFKGLDERACETMLPVRFTRNIRGMECTHGALRPSIGIDYMEPLDGGEYAPSQFEIDNIYPFYLNGKREIIVSSGGRCYRLDEVDKRWRIVGNTFLSGRDSVLFTVDEEPSIIIPKKGGSMYSYNGTTFKDMQLPYTPTTMAVHKNRLYLVDEGDECRLRFSGIDDPYSFEESLDKGGEIYLDVEDGNIVRLISHGGNLYIFREYAIYKLMAYADQRDFEVKKIATTTTKIVGESVALASGRMIFLTKGGLYSFDGYNITPVLESLEDTIRGIEVAEGCYFDGAYYLSYGKGATKKDLLKWNMMTGATSIVEGVNIRAFSIIRSSTEREMLAVAMDGVKYIGIIGEGYYCCGAPLDRHYSIECVDFGIPDIPKEIVGIAVKKTDRYVLTLKADDNVYRFNVDGRRNYYRICARGHVFSFTIEPIGLGEISAPIIEYKV